MSGKETTGFSVQEMKALMEAMRANHVTRLAVKKDEYSLELESGSYAAGMPTAGVPVQPIAGAVPVPAQESQPAPAAPVQTAAGQVVTAPIVGTFYAAAAPDRAPYVQVGSAVKKGDVLFIIESMKLMNEVTSDYDGVVAEIAVENGQGVEYGQPVLVIA